MTTEKRRVFDVTSSLPRSAHWIAGQTRLELGRVKAILHQLSLEGRVHVTERGWLRGPHSPSPVSGGTGTDPSSPTASPSLPAPSWGLPGPVVFTASDPDAAIDPQTGNRRTGVQTMLSQVDELTWETHRLSSVDGWGIVGQAESEGQYAQTVELLQPRTVAHRAVVSTLGLDPAAALSAGVNVCMVECYRQADAVHGDLARMVWQARHDGWPFVWPIVGVYDGIGLDVYVDQLRSLGYLASGMWGIYLGEGMTDTGSWPTLAGLV